MLTSNHSTSAQETSGDPHLVTEQNNREARFSRSALTASVYVQGCVWGFSMTPCSLSHCVTPHFGRANGLTWQRKQRCAVLKQHEIQARQQRVLIVGGILRDRLNLPGVTHMGFNKGLEHMGCNKGDGLKCPLINILGTEKEAMYPHVSLGISQRRDALKHLREECICCTSLSLPALGSGTHDLLQLKLGSRNLSKEVDFFPKMDSLQGSRCQLLKQILSISHSFFKK